MRTTVFILVLGCLLVPIAAASVLVLETERAAAVYATGDRISVRLRVAGDCARGMFGADLDLSVSGDGVRVAAVNPGWGLEPGNSADAVSPSGDRRRISLRQPLRNVNRALAAGGQTVTVATVELEVLSGAPFEAELVVSGKLALLGDPHAADEESQRPQSVPIEPTTITIRNLGTMTADDNPVDPTEGWTRETADVALEAVDSITGESVSTLHAGRTYALRYSTDTWNASGFVLFGVRQQQVADVTIVTARGRGLCNFLQAQIRPDGHF